jgi:hypothetical protein
MLEELRRAILGFPPEMYAKIDKVRQHEKAFAPAILNLFAWVRSTVRVPVTVTVYLFG